MIEPQVRDNIVYSELKEENTFKVKLSPKAFHILSAQLYKNKIRAIVRELSCNAVDAQKAAGVTRPFKVTLPNNMLPIFSIRDFGTGINEEDIYNVYTVLFESTKDQTNDYTGMLGLGSKTPFAYVETFTVTSFQEGIKKTYIAVMGNNRVPSIDKVDTSETDEPNGLQIQFAVRPSEFEEFYRESCYTFSTFFDIKPEITGRELDVFNLQKDYIFYNNRNFIVNPKPAHTGIGFFIVQGGVAYPIDKGQIQTDFFSKYNFVGAVYLNVPIGSVTFTPSREEMDKTDSNMAVIRDLLNDSNLRLELDDKIRYYTDKINCQYDACELAWNIETGKIDCGFKSERFKEIVEEELGFRFTSGIGFSSYSLYSYLEPVKAEVKDWQYSSSLHPSYKYQIYYRDDFSGSLKLIKHDIEERRVRAIIVHKPYDGFEKVKDKDGNIEEVWIEREKHFTPFLEKYRGFFHPIIKSSELKEVYKDAFKKKNKNSEKHEIFAKSNYSGYSDYGLTVDSEFFYMFWQKDDLSAHQNFFYSLLGFWHEDKYQPKPQVYIVRKSDLSTLKLFKKAINVETYLRQKIAKEIGIKAVAEWVYYYRFHSEMSSVKNKIEDIYNLVYPGKDTPFYLAFNNVCGAFIKSKKKFRKLDFINTNLKYCGGRRLSDFLYEQFKLQKYDFGHKRKIDRLNSIYDWFHGFMPILFILDKGDLPYSANQQFRDNVRVLFDHYLLNSKKEKEEV